LINKSASGKMMTSDGTKIRTNSVVRMPPHQRIRASFGAESPKADGGELVPHHPLVIVGAKARKPFPKLIGITGT
jgi:hypothetical protein